MPHAAKSETTAIKQLPAAPVFSRKISSPNLFKGMQTITLEPVSFLLFKITCRVIYGSAGGSECAGNGGDPALIPGLGRSPGEGKGYLFLAGYSLWGQEESDTTQ